MSKLTEFRECLEQKRVFWVTDPGHGWLAVPLTEIDRLGIKPSGYSYVGSGRKGYDGYALLEEDCDAALYLNLALAPIGADIDFPEFTFGQPSGSVANDVRSLDSYASRKVTA